MRVTPLVDLWPLGNAGHPPSIPPMASFERGSRALLSACWRFLDGSPARHGLPRA